MAAEQRATTLTAMKSRHAVVAQQNAPWERDQPADCGEADGQTRCPALIGHSLPEPDQHRGAQQRKGRERREIAEHPEIVRPAGVTGYGYCETAAGDAKRQHEEAEAQAPLASRRQSRREREAGDDQVELGVREEGAGTLTIVAR